MDSCIGFNIHNTSLQEAAFIGPVIKATLLISALALRFVATKHADRKLDWED